MIFEQSVRSYLSFKIKDNITKLKSNFDLYPPLKIETTTWIDFNLTYLFDVKGTKTTSKDDLLTHGAGDYPYVTTKATNNGVDDYFDFYTEEGYVLTIDRAVLGYCSFQERNFSASDHVEKLIPKFKLNKYIAMFLTTVLNQEVYRYSYGRKCNQEKIKNTIIKLPSLDGLSPNWEYMEKYIKTLPFSDKI